MFSELSQKVLAIRNAVSIGCTGAHRAPSGDWMPCSSTNELMHTVFGEEVKSRLSFEELNSWSERRSAKGKRRKRKLGKGWEKLRERGVMSFENIEGGGIVSQNSPSSAPQKRPSSWIAGGTIAPMINGNPNPPNMPTGIPVPGGRSGFNGMSVKGLNEAFSPRDNDVDVFSDIESARARARQIGCIGVSRRVSKTGKIVWMPCTNMTDYANISGTTALGRRHQSENLQRAVRTVLKDTLKVRKKSINEEILGKSLGRTIRGTASRLTEPFDPKAIDGDNDGLIQEGSAFERPGLPSVPKVPDALKTPKTETLKDPVLSDIEVRAASDWLGKLTPTKREELFFPPIDAIENGDTSGLRSFAISRRRGAQDGNPLPSLKLPSNPDATDSNPFANLGGKAMGKIIRRRVKPEHKDKKDRKTFIIGGTTGAGKGHVTEWLQEKGILPKDDEAAHIDPDFIKLGLRGYDDGRGAERVHQESRRSTDLTIRDAASDGMDLVIQGVGKRIEHFRDAKKRGEKVTAHYVYAPSDVAKDRMIERTKKTGRGLSPHHASSIARQIPPAISQLFDENLIDEFYVWDNSVDGGTPKLIASKVPGKKMEIFDKDKFADFAGGQNTVDSWVRKTTRGDKSITDGSPTGGLSSFNRTVPSKSPSKTVNQVLQNVESEAAKGLPRNDISDYATDVSKVVSRAIPTSQQELEQMLRDNPFVPGDGSEAMQFLLKSSKEGKIDWDRQKKLADVLAKTLEDSPSLRKLLSITDIPPIIVTDSRADNDLSVSGFTLQTDRIVPWAGVYGLYHTQKGFIMMKPEVIEGKKVEFEGRNLTPEYLLRHEIGHAIHAMLIKKHPQAAEELQNYHQLLANRADEIAAKLDKINKELSTPAYQLNKALRDKKIKEAKVLQNRHLSWVHDVVKETDARSISNYAATNIFEYIAEAISHLTAPDYETSEKNGLKKIQRAVHLGHLSELLGFTREELDNLLG